MLCFFSSFISFWSSERSTENTMSDLYVNEESDYSEENATGLFQNFMDGCIKPSDSPH